MRTALEPITVTQLTDEERMALSFAHHELHLESRLGPLIETGLDHVKVPDGNHYDREVISKLWAAQQSLVRLGLLEQYHLTRYAKGGEVGEAERVGIDPERSWITQTVLHLPDRDVTFKNDQAMRDAGWGYAGWGYGAGWNYRLTDLGREWLKAYKPFGGYACCDGCVQLPCVCRCRTFCAHPEHRSGCHGTHD